MKRLFDVVVAGTALVLVAPVLAVLAVLIKLDSPGPILFRQRRVGLGGDEFELLKLRSMVADAPSRGGHSTLPGDSRITRVGRLVRTTSLDELPQLLNVLRGEMSIVGPRPNVPAQVSEYRPDVWSRRLTVKPGITGLAQARGRSAATSEQRLDADLEYVDDHRISTDLRICMLTVAQLFRGGSN